MQLHITSNLVNVVQYHVGTGRTRHARQSLNPYQVHTQETLIHVEVDKL